MKFIPSPHHFGRQGHKIKGIVIHRMAGTFQGTISWFQNPESKVSSHYLISQDGDVVQMVRDQEAAWHAGYKSGTPPAPYREVANPNWISIGIECEDRTADNVNFWTQKELNTLVELCRILIDQYNIPIDRDHIVGHSDIDPQGKPHDPGKYFPWDEFIAYLKEPNEPSRPDKDLSDYENEILQLREQLLQVEKRYKGEVFSLREQHLHLEKERDEARRERDGLKEELGKKEVVILDLKKKETDLNEKLAELSSKRDELAGVVSQLRTSEKSLRGLIGKLQKENKVKGVSELRLPEFDTSKPYVRFLQIFFWNGLSGVIPVLLTVYQNDPRFLALAPVINGAAKVLKDFAEERNKPSV